MIRRSFIFLDRIGPKQEANIRKQGINDWQDFLEQEKIKGISNKAKSYYNRKIKEARTELFNGNSSYFTKILPTAEVWRLYDFFEDQSVFLDIETSGVSMSSFITVFGLYDGMETKIMVRDINLDLNKLKKELKNYRLIVTFNGSSFDIPFIRKRYQALLPNIPHFDLKHACIKLGLTGGLKEVERSLGIKRQNPIVERLYGGDPYLLWRMFKGSGEEHYLKLLVEYNEEDVINLKQIADYVYEKMKDNF
ncbi:ribonuclease H-like domain-containing protein [Candidatus Woesearchaeota archaeon]|nr:ribonuclease H-like domain-containing protein [Candidatus Woesearchaeota archaeon]